MTVEELTKLVQEKQVEVDNRIEQYEEDIWNDFFMEHNLTEQEVEYVEAIR